MKRVITGPGPDGRDAILEQSVVHPIAGMAESKNQTRLCWATQGLVRLPHEGEDPVAGAAMTMPAPGDCRFVFVTFPPGSVTPLHATPTVDCVAVVSGEIWLVMEDGGESRLSAGDAVIQNGARHIWTNRSTEPCTIAAVMIGAQRS